MTWPGVIWACQAAAAFRLMSTASWLKRLTMVCQTVVRGHVRLDIVGGREQVPLRSCR